MKKPQIRESDVCAALEHFLTILHTRKILAWRRILTTGSPIPAGGGLFRLIRNSKQSGMSDYIVGVQGDVVLVEIKRPGGKQRPGQVEFEQDFVGIAKCRYWLIEDVRDFALRLEKDYCIKHWAFPG
ncbi:MAG: hypothetical protein E6R04_10210 [Spirochaetes bacterium]|nr:MAG: hypothetical protein E6R04_10210 [Spirochaetota bacterium]